MNIFVDMNTLSNIFVDTKQQMSYCKLRIETVSTLALCYNVSWIFFVNSFITPSASNTNKYSCTLVLLINRKSTPSIL